MLKSKLGNTSSGKLHIDYVFVKKLNLDFTPVFFETSRRREEMVLSSLNFLVPPVFFFSSLEDSPGKMHIFALTYSLRK